jgi:hypothetical protein
MDVTQAYADVEDETKAPGTPELHVTPNRARPFQNIARLWRRGDVSLPTKLVGTAFSPVRDAFTSFSRTTSYNPFGHSVASFDNDPAVLAQALGRAADVGSRKWKAPYSYAGVIPGIDIGQQINAARIGTAMLPDDQKAHGGRVGGGLVGSMIGGSIPVQAVLGPAAPLGWLAGSLAGQAGGAALGASAKGVSPTKIVAPVPRQVTSKKKPQGKKDDDKEKDNKDKKDTKSAAYTDASVAHQSYMPIIQNRRQLTPEEESRIKARESKWFPRIFTGMGTPVEDQIASPTRSALLRALLGGGLGALLGGGLGARIGAGSPRNPNGMDSVLTGAGIGAGAGALLGAPIAGIPSYFAQKAKNDEVKEMMKRLPPDATMRDWNADPAMQAQADRYAMIMAASKPRFGLGMMVDGG